ncbi:transposase family protein [Clostridium putrefaciens]|uniref:Transposase family protein n=1 Tax=Clostridium putrefaciens TaxID=99675 RepID=A0A381JC30_9CLOT|nr:transposase [Clostridium putrefaciens]SUY48076.1 transposase family protein [Clostridium putrefaciens]SUY48318.1 transposase family protein [Clostridium putrefaciens]
MNTNYLKQMLTYINKVYHIGKKINTLKDKRIKFSAKVSTISFVVLFGFILQIRSFNRLEHLLEKNKFKKLLPKKTKVPRIDTVRRSLSDFDLEGLNNMHNQIIKTAVKNKVFRASTMDGLKVVAIDGVELFESTKKCCDKCLSRVHNGGVTHYFHRSVVCSTVGSDPHLILGQEMLEPKTDGSNKDEGETTGGKRLINRLYKEFHHFADIIVADALYCKSTWIKEVLSIGMNAVVRVKDERLHIVKDALALFKCREPNKKWVVNRKSNNYIKIKAWDEDNFEMSNSEIKVRFIKFIEEVHKKDKVEIKESWIITTDKFTSVETLWKIMHKRWDIENNAFHQLKTEWHLDHCFLHSPTGVETVLMFIVIAFNLMQLYFFRCIRGFRRKRMLQINIIEDLRDEMLLVQDWINPIFDTT